MTACPSSTGVAATSANLAADAATATGVSESTFREFIEAPLFKGLGEKLADIERLIADDDEAVVRFRRLTVAPKGTNQHTGEKEDADNISILPDLFTPAVPAKKKADAGTSRAYTLDRLEKERPDLFEKVVAKELTANRAAIEAGWRKKETALDTVKRTRTATRNPVNLPPDPLITKRTHVASKAGDAHQVSAVFQQRPRSEHQHPAESVLHKTENQHAERKQIYERLHPETRHITEKGGPGRGNKTTANLAVVLPSYAADAAAATGVSESTVRRKLYVQVDKTSDFVQQPRDEESLDAAALPTGAVNYLPIRIRPATCGASGITRRSRIMAGRLEDREIKMIHR